MKKMKLVMVGNGMAGVRTLEELIKLEPELYDITTDRGEKKNVLSEQRRAYASMRSEAQQRIQTAIKTMNGTILPALDTESREALQRWLEEKRQAMRRKVEQ